MSQDRTPDFTLEFTSQELNTLIRGTSEAKGHFTRHFNGSEEFFLQLEEAFTVPSLHIHHPVSNLEPSTEYLESLKAFIKGILPQIGPVLAETNWYFNPRDIFRPGFYQLYDIKGKKYLFILRLDLGIRPRGCEIIDPGTNDQSPSFTTRNLFLDAEIVPLEPRSGTKKEFWIQRLFSDTWQGEQGRGYFVQGVWIDDSLSKFFTKALLPRGKKIYPYYPFRCRYSTLSSTVVSFDTHGRHKAIKLLDRAITDLGPQLQEVQQLLGKNDFSEDLPLYQEIQARLAPLWAPIWESVRVQAYLNQDEQKEFIYED